MPNFPVVDKKMWAYSPQNRENGIFGINLCLTKNSGGPQKTLNIGAQLQNFLCAMTYNRFENYTASQRFRYHKVRHSKA